jgi:hypothetical protein
MKLVRTATFAAIAILLSGAPGLGQSAPQAQTTETARKPETVIVTGHRPQEDIDTVVSRFVDLHAAPNRKTGQYMRDDSGPVCPITLGLPQAFNDFVTARLIQVATSVGAKTDSTGKCKPNVEVLFTDEPAAVVKTLAERTHGMILGMHFVHEERQLLKVTRPIQSWYVTGTRMDENSAEPVTVTDRGGMTKSADDKKPGIDSAYRNGPDRISTGSWIPNRRISSIMNVLIVADTRELHGAEIGPVADYIAMIALSEPRSLEQCAELPSILDLMSSDCGARPKPDKLTDSDVAYLKGLYAADLGVTTTSMQKEDIQKGMTHALSTGPLLGANTGQNSN